MNLKYILTFLVIIISLSSLASATDWTIGNPMGLGHTNRITDQFTLTNNNASAGFIDSIDLRSDGSYSRNSIFQNCNNCLYGMINPIDNTRWGSDEAGNVFYTTAITPINYSSGFYACCDAFGNPTNSNNLHRIATLSASTTNRKMTFDSSGDIYIADGGSIKKYIKSLGYAEQTFYTLTSGVDYQPADGNPAFNVIGMQIDSSNILHILIGSYCTGGGCIGFTGGYVSYTVISSSGVRIKSDLSLASDLCGGVACTPVGIANGGLSIDSTNPNQNYTYAYYSQHGATAYLKHNSSAGTTTTATLTGITSIGDIGYNNYQIYITSPSQNLVRSYATNFEGFGFSQIPTNPDGITGTFSWLNGYGTTITTITPGAALAYKWTISDELSNYTFYSGWGTDTQTEPANLHDLTNLDGLSKPAVFPTSSNDLAGVSIYGYLLAKRNNDSSWSMLINPQILTISPATVGFDSITLDKSFYNLTGDTITATFTYSSTSPIWLYQWQICSRADCADGYAFEGLSLADHATTNTKATDGMARGNYYAVLMRHLPFLSNEIVASQRFDIRPPVIGVSWDKPEYNLLPDITTSTCSDSTPTTSYWSNVSGYAGLQTGWFSCITTPSEASANNSIMRGSLFARYNGTFYLNNSLGSIWNGTLSNGSGTILYILTNSSVTETWTLAGVNASGETFYATTEVMPESLTAYTLSVSPSTAYNTDTLYLTFTKPIYRLADYVILKDASGATIASYPTSATSGTYYIDPTKSYTYGTWTAYWYAGASDPSASGTTTYTITVKNAGKPTQNGSTVPENSAEYTGFEIANLLSSKIFWALLFIICIILAVAAKERGGK